MRITSGWERPSLVILAGGDGAGYLRASTLSTPPAPAAAANTVADTAGAAGGSFSRAIRRRASSKKTAYDVVCALGLRYDSDVCVLLLAKGSSKCFRSCCSLVGISVIAMGAALFPAASLARAFVVRLAKVAAAGLGLFVLA